MPLDKASHIFLKKINTCNSSNIELNIRSNTVEIYSVQPQHFLKLRILKRELSHISFEFPRTRLSSMDFSMKSFIFSLDKISEFKLVSLLKSIYVFGLNASCSFLNN